MDGRAKRKAIGRLPVEGLQIRFDICAVTRIRHFHAHVLRRAETGCQTNKTPCGLEISRILLPRRPGVWICAYHSDGKGTGETGTCVEDHSENVG